MNIQFLENLLLGYHLNSIQEVLNLHDINGYVYSGADGGLFLNVSYEGDVTTYCLELDGEFIVYDIFTV